MILKVSDNEIIGRKLLKLYNDYLFNSNSYFHTDLTNFFVYFQFLVALHVV